MKHALSSQGIMVASAGNECSRCGAGVSKLIRHPGRDEALCVRCMADADLFTLKEYRFMPGDDRRGAIRIPLTVALDIIIDTDNRTEIRYPALSVDLSTSGICFAWEPCSRCPGRPEHGAHPECLFYVQAVNHPAPRPFTIEFTIAHTHVIRAEALVVHVQEDRDLGLDYIGACFTDITNQTRRVLEKLIIRFGASLL